MLLELITVMALTYTCISYASLVGEPFDQIDLWLDFVCKCISVLIQTIAVYVDMHRSFPMIVFEDENYEPPASINVAKYALWTIYFLIMGFMVLMSIVFIQNIDQNLARAFFHLICFSLISMTLVAFLKDAYSDCSGYAYCDFLDSKSNQKCNRSYLPCSLPDAEMEIYNREFYLVVKRE